jgi:hypothetical protein
LAIPKSITFTTGCPSCSVTITFDGLMSRWMIPFWCACSTAWHTFWNSSSRSRIDSFAVSQYSVIGTPRTSSITKYGRPVGVAPASSTFAMLGWSIMASACRSASNRPITCRVSIPGLTIFSATFRLIGAVCCAMYTNPKPPSPISCSTLYGPIIAPGCSRTAFVIVCGSPLSGLDAVVPSPLNSYARNIPRTR